MKAIGQHYADSGLQSVWTESSMFGDNTFSNSMSAKSYNRTIRAHKLTLPIGSPVANHMASVSRVGERQRFDDADLQRLSKQLPQSLDDNGEDETHLK